MHLQARLRNARPDSWVFFLAFFIVGVFGSYSYLRSVGALPPLTELSSWKWVKVEKTAPVKPLKNYSDENLHFSFNYPEDLNLYHVSDEAYLSSYYKEGERVPYAEVYLEEANGPLYQAQSLKEEVFRGFLGLLPPFQGMNKPKRLIGYNVVITVDRKWLSETLPVLTERYKDKLCAETAAGETVSVTDTEVNGEPAREIKCGEKTISTVVLDPNNGNHYFKITGTLSTSNPVRREAFENAYNQMVSSFSFLNNQ